MSAVELSLTDIMAKMVVDDWGQCKSRPVRRAARPCRGRQAVGGDAARRDGRDRRRPQSRAASATTRPSCSGIAACRCPTSRSATPCWKRRRGSASASGCATPDRWHSSPTRACTRSRRRWRRRGARCSPGSARRAGVPLSYLDHAAPAPLEDLWARDDLGAAFMCGYPFAIGGAAAAAAGGAGSVAAALRRAAASTAPISSCARTAASRASRDTFGGRIGWTVAHSQSGYNAVRHHLLAPRRSRSRSTAAGSDRWSRRAA